MKHFLLSLVVSLVFFVQIYAHAPIFDYTQINTWCDFIKLSKAELTLFQSYLKDGKELAEQCSHDPHFVNSPQGKGLQNNMDELVQQFLKDAQLKEVFQYFVELVREELAQNIHEQNKDKVKRNYRLLAMVFDACLDCIQDKLANEKVVYEL